MQIHNMKEYDPRYGGKKMRKAAEHQKSIFQAPFLYRVEERTLLVNFLLQQHFVEVLKYTALVRKSAH